MAIRVLKPRQMNGLSSEELMISLLLRF
jgi:hypothetical protein